MNKLIVDACTGVLSLVALQYAIVQTTSAKSTVKKALAKKKVTKKAELVAAAKPEDVQQKCELGNELYIASDMIHGRITKLHWKDRNYDPSCQLTCTGADRYFDQKIGFDLVVIPAKAMLFDRNEGHRPADECQTAEMAAGTPAPTQAGALRAPAGLPLTTPDSPTPAPTLAPGTAQPAQQ